MAHVLLIDDDQALRDILAHILRLLGHEVTQAANGKEGVQCYRTRQADIVVTDLIMPEQEGLETILILRREFPAVRIIAMSGGARGSSSYLHIAEKLGARRALAKPFTGHQLAHLIDEVLVTPESPPP